MAFWKAAPLTSAPFTDVLLGVFWTWSSSSPLVGSRKFDTPRERMHFAKASALDAPAGSFWLAVDPPALGCEEPQAANPRAAVRRSRRKIVGRMPKWYETGHNTDETDAVTAALPGPDHAPWHHSVVRREGECECW